MRRLRLRSSPSSVEARLSSTALTASCASTRSARWIPPRRSSPSRTPLYQMGHAQITVTASTSRSFHLRSARTGSLPSLFFLQRRHGVAGNLDLDVGCDAQLDDVVGDAGHHAVNAARGDDLVAVLQVLDHLLHGFLLLVGGTDEEEVENDEDEPHRHEEGEKGVGSLLRTGRLQGEKSRTTDGRHHVYHADVPSPVVVRAL